MGLRDYERGRRYVADHIFDYADGIYSFDGFNKTVQTKLGFTNWGLFPKEEQMKVYAEIKDVVQRNRVQLIAEQQQQEVRAIERQVSELQQTTEEIRQELEKIPEVSFPTRNRALRYFDKIKRFLGRLF